MRSRRVLWLVPLGFSAGLPLLLCGSTLTAWLTSAGVDLATAGALSLAGLPYSLKFLWAPLFDALAPPGPLRRLGARRGFLLPVQLLLCATLAALPRSTTPGWWGALALCCGFLGATQDILVDAYRSDVLAPEERGAGTAAYVLGYRLAMVTAGSLALLLGERLSFQRVYLLMAGLLGLCTLATLAAPAPPVTAPAQGGAARAAWRALREGWPRLRPALPLVLLYKLGDTLALGLIPAFLLLRGFSKSDVGALGNGVGLLGTFAGTALSGLLLDRVGIRRGLLWFGVLQAACNLGYLALAGPAGAARGLLVATVLLDNCSGALGSCALMALLASLCAGPGSATQYALLTSLSGVLGRLLGGAGGVLAQRLGWPAFFALSMVLAVPGLLLCARRPADGDLQAASECRKEERTL